MRYHEFRITEDKLNEINMSPNNLATLVNTMDAKIGIEYEFVYIEKQLKNILSKDSPKTWSDVYSAFIDTYDLKRTMFYTFQKMKQKNNPEISFDEVYDLWEEISSTDITPILKELGISSYKDMIEKYNLEFKNYFLINGLEKKFNNFVNPKLKYEIKTDASIKDNNGSAPVGNKIGAEIVSQPQSFEQTIIELEKIRQFILKNGYTNETTGLHINVSLPNFDRNNLDYIKLVLLTGDRYVLSQFDRSFNKYAWSSIGKMSHDIKSGHTDLSVVLDAFKQQLTQTAAKMVYLDTNKKEVSIGMKPDRIEFRSPGGNWTETITPDFMKQTVMRFIVALDAALDPTKYQQEYAKKLYKLFSETMKHDKNNVSKIFSEYFIGNITREQLHSKLKGILKSRKDFNDFLDSIDLDELGKGGD